MNNKKRKFVVVTMVICIGMAMMGCSNQNNAANQNNTQSDDTSQNEKTQEQMPSAEASLRLALDDYPRIDGSTANLPLMAEVLSEVCGLTQEEAQEYVSCSKTSQAWLRLANGDMDLLLVYEPDEFTKAQLEEMNVMLEITPIGRDGLVFINNKDNPVKGLTTEQLQGIYTGNITNWQQVGGDDSVIEAFQRKETSGSQAMFRKLLMKNLEPMDAPSEYRPTEMGELIDMLADYNDSASAIGYSVYYYVSEMYARPGLQLMEVDGVAPTNDTIGDGSYPFTNEFFVVIRADEPENSVTRQLYNWIISEEGKAALVKAGYVPVGE